MNEKLRAILVDDEKPALDLMEKILNDTGKIEIIGLCKNGFEAVKMSSELKPDVIFLDIEMPKLNGFDVVELLSGEKLPYIVFITAYSDYAVEAFEKEAIDYILKPVSIERVEKTIKKIQTNINRMDLINKISNIKKDNNPISRILIKNGVDIDIIAVEDIYYIKADDDYIRIFTKDKSYLKNGKLSVLEEQLPTLFVKTHRSYIININYLKKIEPYSKTSKIAILENKSKIPVSKAGYLKLKDRF